MPDHDFPHLYLSFRGSFDPKFQSGRAGNPEVEANQKNPKGHAVRLKSILGLMRKADAELRVWREQHGLPAIPSERGFLLKLPEGFDVESLVAKLGVELVAETEEGLMLVSSTDLDFQKLEQVLDEFEKGLGSKIAGSNLLDIYDKPDDPRRLDNVLSPEVRALWPFAKGTVYTFDIGIQTATSSRNVDWPKRKKRKGESEAHFLKRREEARKKAWVEACTEWDDKAGQRVQELADFIAHYGGNITSSIISDQPKEEEKGMVFPDSAQIRVEMRGEGFTDVVLNFPHIFDVALPPDIQQFAGADQADDLEHHIEVLEPGGGAPTVCVIDSGIEEEHYCLGAAIDGDRSRCFIPGTKPDDVGDYVAPQGHGTRVAGAVLYPEEIPADGKVEPVAWIQNARVLNNENKLPKNLTPEDYLQRVVTHFHAEPKFTKIFNHSVNSDVPCPKHRMTAWAAKIDQLSHEHDVLFIQSAGNQDRWDAGDEANTGLRAHLEAGRQPPAHQLEASMRIANPGQSLHALTVGAVAGTIYDNASARSYALKLHQPSGFSRCGYGEPWGVVKPEVVELGGDLIYSKAAPILVKKHKDVSIELLNSTMHNAPAFSKDGIGTSFAAPKVAHIAAHLQNLFPSASPLLYRTLIVQSARWPGWTEAEQDKDKVLKLVGYGFPSLERATTNSERRVTLITPDAEILPSKKLHLYTVEIPQELRSGALEAKIRIDVTLAYTALPRRTRARRTGYLETWLDWESSKLGEPRNVFLNRMQNGGKSAYEEFPWTLHKRQGLGDAQATSRNRGSVQKDWAVFDSFDFPQEFAIAVRSHIGWNHLAGAGSARYCLAVTFEVVEGEVDIYSLIESQTEVAAEAVVKTSD